MPETMPRRLTDTDPAIDARRIEGLRRMSPAQRLALASAWTHDDRQLALAGIRSRHPGISQREAMLRLAAMTVDRATLVRAFGWSPEQAGC